MRVAIALAAGAFLATTSGCSFRHGGNPDDPNPGDAAGEPPDSLVIDAPKPDAIAVDANTMPDASTVTPLLQHDFENSVGGPFTGIYLMPNDQLTDSSTAHGGQKSAFCRTQAPADAQATLYLDVSDRAQLYGSMWIRLGTGFPPSDYVMVMTFVDTDNGWANVAQVSVFPDLRVSIYNVATTTDYFSTTKLTTGTWYRIEALAKVSPTAGRLMLAINGVVQVNQTNINTGSMQLDKILMGIAWQGAPTAPTTLYVDDVRIE